MTSEATDPGTFTLDTKLSGALGGRTAQAFQRAFGYTTVGDLLAHYPRRYAQRGELTVLETLPLGENVTIVADVLEARTREMRQRRGSIFEAVISDGTGKLTLTFFNQPWREGDLRPGRRGVFAGKVSDYRGGRQLAHPAYELFDDAGPEIDAATRRWIEAPLPIYPATSTLTSWQIAKSIVLLLDGLGAVDEPVPAELRRERGLLSYREALQRVHRPERDGDWRAAERTLRFMEAFVLQAALLSRRAALLTHRATPRRPAADGLLSRFDAGLPFSLTGDQSLVGEEIATDLAKPWPMHRLVQGEVGSGKTLVALRAMLAVADSGGQAALLAPTEVLAAQHLRSISKMLGPDLSAQVMPTLVTGQLPAAERRKALLRAAAGQARIVVGTHALLGEKVSFADLGLVVVDEQHRFGVEQREALRLKGEQPHVLVLTATPIPRTVAMTVFGDLDVSTIHELPAGRAGIESHVVPLAVRPGWRPRIWSRLVEELALGRQGFVVCPAIDAKVVEDDGDQSDVDRDEDGGAAPARPGASVVEVLAELRAHPGLADRRVEPLHGRMSADEKDAVMRAFAAGEIDVLVATTVIEVGVDVPNASAMVVIDADRFGVSQLHQLRGRVGRGSVPGLCLLVTHAEPGSVALQRVEAVAATLDGFELAQVDLELRREGDVLGATQSGGRSSLKFLRVARDGDLIAEARASASAIIDDGAGLAGHPELAAAVRRLDDDASTFLSKG
ncbi:ATP-dependent DNA helicase RecG [Agromyces aerolatus]|uniref:ATP-dependent DNA helicase RecG n=1 Tax=Agromyces sp. LY-1074 TaxID=3074080 RepID=UPI00285B729F|nr:MULTISPECIES: ATP-dependent DNA helicase RecG [unclassified Agromyces]MDR5699991.1 ATP-dependent DNA helicase RecG [Agromyces sp. LY-1074]MDR5706197.1 ATP-dependent DNA helicase RecG [Agromyces sp. LY-1358]